jgi:hypothetical protein
MSFHVRYGRPIKQPDPTTRDRTTPKTTTKSNGKITKSTTKYTTTSYLIRTPTNEYVPACEELNEAVFLGNLKLLIKSCSKIS